jgi:hypothetical protein
MGPTPFGNNVSCVTVVGFWLDRNVVCKYTHLWYKPSTIIFHNAKTYISGLHVVIVCRCNALQLSDLELKAEIVLYWFYINIMWTDRSKINGCSALLCETVALFHCRGSWSLHFTPSTIDLSNFYLFNWGSRIVHLEFFNNKI